jgi:hypothetical protein
VISGRDAIPQRIGYRAGQGARSHGQPQDHNG